MKVVLGLYVILFVVLMYLNCHAQYYYSPTPPTYYQYPGGVLSPQYQQDQWNFEMQRWTDEKRAAEDRAYERERTYYRSRTYDDPWGFKRNSNSRDIDEE